MMLITQAELPRVASKKINIHDYRCQSCGRLLFRAHIPYIPGVRIEIRCKCARMVIIVSGENINVTNQPD